MPPPGRNRTPCACSRSRTVSSGCPDCSSIYGEVPAPTRSRAPRQAPAEAEPGPGISARSALRPGPAARFAGPGRAARPDPHAGRRRARSRSARAAGPVRLLAPEDRGRAPPAARSGRTRPAAGQPRRPAGPSAHKAGRVPQQARCAGLRCCTLRVRIITPSGTEPVAHRPLRDPRQRGDLEQRQPLLQIEVLHEPGEVRQFPAGRTSSSGTAGLDRNPARRSRRPTRCRLMPTIVAMRQVDRPWQI